MSQIFVNNLAPNFSLPDQDGKIVSLSAYQGKWVLLYFYPKDFTPGCTVEACNFRDNFSELRAKGVEVFGISADSVKSHAKFKEHYRLPFTLLTDLDNTVGTLYTAYREKVNFGKTYMGIARISFLIDPRGIVVKQYNTMKPESHVQDVLKDLEKFQAPVIAVKKAHDKKVVSQKTVKKVIAKKVTKKDVKKVAKKKVVASKKVVKKSPKKIVKKVAKKVAKKAVKKAKK